MGVSGLGIIAQLNNFITFINHFVPLGIPNGIAKFASEEFITEEEKLKRIFSTSAKIVFYPTLLFSIILFLLPGKISFFLFQTSEYTDYIRIISLAIPLIVLSSMFEGYIRGLKVITAYSRIIIFSNLASLAALIPLTIIYGITGALFGIISSSFFYVVISFYFLWKKGLIKRTNFNEKFDRSLLYKLLKVSSIFLLSGSLFQLSLLLLRKIIIAEFGVYYNGIFQSVIGISLNYFGFIFLFLSLYTFPTISKLKLNSEIVDELNDTVRYIIILMVPLVILIFTLRSFVISLLFSKEFLASENLFAFQFMGDFFKAIAWAIGIWLIPKMRLKAFIILEIVLNLNLVLIFYFLLKVAGLNILYVSFAYMIAYSIHFLLNFLVSRRLISFGFTKDNYKLIIQGFIFLVSSIVVSYLNYYLGIIIVLPVIIIWVFIVLTKEERDEIKHYVLSRG